MAWLRATPEESSSSRWAEYTAREAEVPLPSIEGYEYLISLLESAGTILQTGMGIAPLTWQELECWKRCYEAELLDNCWEFSFWEFSMIKDLSYAYCSELSNATDKKREAPYRTEVVDRTDVSNRMYSLFMGFKPK